MAAGEDVLVDGSEPRGDRGRPALGIGQAADLLERGPERMLEGAVDPEHSPLFVLEEGYRRSVVHEGAKPLLALPQRRQRASRLQAERDGAGNRAEGRAR